jgi:hypothetical protein
MQFVHAVLVVACIQAQWKEGFNGGSKGNDGWLSHNPQFVINLTSPSKIVIILNQLEIGKPVGLYLIRSTGTFYNTPLAH